MNEDLAKLYYGTSQPVAEARRLQAGPWSALLIDGSLHDIRYRDVEVIRAVAFLVRDKDWGTCRPVLSGVEIDQTESGFRVAYRAHCANPDGHALSYALSMDCAGDRALSFSATVTAHDAFLTARCGFCVLHPLDGVAGAPARVEHGDGTRESAAFPALIVPWQPFKNIRSIAHDMPCGLTVRCAFTGDVFELEDQRNWSDASFKTYSRPLALPWPFTLDAGATFTQTVTLGVEETTHATLAPPASHESEDRVVTVDPNESADEPMPALGIAIATDEIDIALDHLPLLAEFAPHQLTLSFDPTAGDGLRELERFAALQRHSGIPCVLECALPGVDVPRAEFDALASLIEASRLTLTGIVVSPSVHRQSNPPGSVSPPCPALDEVYREARRAFPRLRIGGGMLSYFTELNRKRPPLELVDWTTHATCPIVHAADDRSVMQTLEAIAHITRSCRALIGAQPYSIGPVSIGMRQNPYGSRVMPNPHGERIAMAACDPRQRALFGGAWLAGYAAALAGARIDTLTLGALTGARGLADVSDGVRRYPMFKVAKALARMAGATRLMCVGVNPREIACVAARDAYGHIHLVIANLTDASHAVRLDLRDMIRGSLDAVVIDEVSPQGREKRLASGERIEVRPFACLIATSGPP
ncbi:conserved hypothetical protein [Paraburkholderia piptadeniae]|uniref:Uncharacterized protein n=1 Tax=Paraburkholderia piptadeniae TaxID=1701573 RepID=A0A1N7SVN0_9BURK|nr:hypothetical protein [Paraburkholderia piptadeniae]SIT51528.1 conserved hypothetical protein [Paraburkholderia piptadeniae]